MLTACSADKYSKKDFCTNLFSDYTAEADYSVSDGEKSISGKMSVSKSDYITVTLTSPSEYEGIEITSDSTGKSDVLSLELSGIPAEIPKSIARDLSLMLTLFSDVIPSRVSSLAEECFATQEGSGLVSVSFAENGTDYLLIYDTVSCLPVSFDAGNEEMSLKISFTDINLQKQKELK